MGGGSSESAAVAEFAADPEVMASGCAVAVEVRLMVEEWSRWPVGATGMAEEEISVSEQGL